jgi:hypothetical protein
MKITRERQPMGRHGWPAVTPSSELAAAAAIFILKAAYDRLFDLIIVQAVRGI